MESDNTSEKLPTVYEYYTAGGIQGGLSDAKSQFMLNNKEIIIFSGALHYFRVPKEYWRDRLRKFRASGLNCVETYVPWNLHEPQENTFDFGDGASSTDFSEFLDIERFIKLAQEEDLLVILRPGPYICAEWEFGGLPSWLLRYKNMKVRTSDEKFIEFVERYFGKLLKLIAPLQFTKGGAVIAVQIENEYGNTKEWFKPIDTVYLEKLKDILRTNGIVELLFTSDTPSNGFSGTLPGVLATANFQDKPLVELGLLKVYQPTKPLMVMEYWTGWFDHWSEKHHTRTAEDFGNVLESILKFGSSFNLYMMHGGTNWGFLNGANLKGDGDDNEGYQPDVTSYDYDAPLSENGDYTDKYKKLQELTTKYLKIQLKNPELPKLSGRTAYAELKVIGELSLGNLVSQAKHVIDSEDLQPMELLDINNQSGQSYGYVVYKKQHIHIPKNAILKIEGRVCDTAIILVNGELKSKILENNQDLNSFGYWRSKDAELHLGPEEYKDATLEILVENWGRVNYGKVHQFNQHKGLWQGNVLLNNVTLKNWKIIPLEFQKSWTNSLSDWRTPNFEKQGPKLYKTNLIIDDQSDCEPIKDTYVDTREWIKGFIVVNGFVLARYCKLGPQLTSYLPGVFLKKGVNEVLIFEHFEPAKAVNFVTDPLYLQNK